MNADSERKLMHAKMEQLLVKTESEGEKKKVESRNFAAGSEDVCSAGPSGRFRSRKEGTMGAVCSTVARRARAARL